jgi:hypothetical protein
VKPNIVLDIETRHWSELLDDQDYLDELDESIGENRAIKDPFKQQVWKDQKKADHLRKMALHPTTGVVVCAGLTDLRYAEEDPVIMSSFENEAWLLAEFVNAVTNRFPTKRVVCGHNIREFDIPFVTARCAIHDIPLPSWWPFTRDWHNVADLMDIVGKKGKLSEWCRAFGISAPTHAGEDVLTLSEMDLREHNREDLVATAAIMRRFAKRFPSLRNTHKKELAI